MTEVIMSDGPASLFMTATSCLITDYFASLQKVILFPVKVCQGVSIVSEVAPQSEKKTMQLVTS